MYASELFSKIMTMMMMTTREEGMERGRQKKRRQMNEQTAIKSIARTGESPRDLDLSF